MSKKIMCFGDSLTNGLMGSPYIGVNYDVEKDGVDGIHSSKKTAKLADEAITKILESL